MHRAAGMFGLLVTALLGSEGCGSSSPPSHASSPASCQGAGPGLTACGAVAQDCCTSLAVPAGSFDRSYDGVTFSDPSAPATVSAFRLDAVEVTVARFRAFVDAVVTGWRPAAGSGKHTGLPSGGLNGGAESGWDPGWTANLATTAQDWTAGLQCGEPYATWTAGGGANEALPINCVTWFEAYAFCIWDGGVLPTEAEWNFAAAGGGEQRVYPWSVPPSSTTVDYSYASYDCLGESCDPTDIQPVGSDPKGAGKWGQLDLGGSMWEWTLDWFVDPYPTPCTDCAALTSGTNRVLRGGSYDYDATGMLASARDSNAPLVRNESYGVRCARSP